MPSRTFRTLPLSYLDAHPTGDTVSRMIADVDTFADGLLMGFTQLFTGVMTILGTLGFMLTHELRRSRWWSCCITPLSLLVANFIATADVCHVPACSPPPAASRPALIDETIGNQKVVQAFGHEDETPWPRSTRSTSGCANARCAAMFFSSLTNPCTRFVNSRGVCRAWAWRARWSAVCGGITVGSLAELPQLRQPVYQAL